MAFLLEEHYSPLRSVFGRLLSGICRIALRGNSCAIPLSSNAASTPYRLAKILPTKANNVP